ETCGRLVKFRLLGRTYRWWIWRRLYFRTEQWPSRTQGDYMYDSLLTEAPCASADCPQWNQETGHTICAGDGTGRDCASNPPSTGGCANGDSGHGCANSLFLQGGLLSMTGASVIHNGTDPLVMSATDLASTGFVVCLQGTTYQGANGLGIFRDDGILCV